MVTGGFRTLSGMNYALSEGIDLIGAGRPFCVEPDFPNKFLSGQSKEIECKESP